MKRLLSVILMLALLMLPVQAGAASTFQFTRENFPRMDGSTSLVPLGTGITSVLLGLISHDKISVPKCRYFIVTASPRGKPRGANF